MKGSGGMDQDNFEAIKLSRRRQFEEERKKRIFDAKTRLYGVDLDTLQRQIDAKHKQQQIQNECDERYQANANRLQEAIYSKMLDETELRKHNSKELAYYHCTQQRFPDRREFDLNDPNALRKSKPARSSDYALELGLASAQVFQGEDLQASERRQMQRAQQRAWLDQQLKERRDAVESRRRANEMLNMAQMAHEQRLSDMATADRKLRDYTVNAIREFNMEMANDKRLERQRQKMEKQQDDMAEIYNMLTSDMLTENPDVATSKTNPSKKVAYMYRGMTPEEAQRFRKEQLQQLQDARKQKKDDTYFQQQWHQFSANQDREVLLKQRECERKAKANYNDLTEFNQQLSQQQREQHQTQNELMKRNDIRPEFFAQFNKDAR